MKKLELSLIESETKIILEALIEKEAIMAYKRIFWHIFKTKWHIFSMDCESTIHYKRMYFRRTLAVFVDVIRKTET